MRRHCARCHFPLAALQRGDYGATQPDWYQLLFRNCSGCSLSGGGTVDGRARLWVLPQRQQEEREDRQLQQLQQRQRPVLLPRKAVRNWADPSCPKPEECRCMHPHRLPCPACLPPAWFGQQQQCQHPLNDLPPWMLASGRGWWVC